MSALSNKVVLVTGAGRGCGRRIAESFAARGAQVAAVDVTPVNLDETVKNIRSAGGKVTSYIADIAKKLPIQGLLNQVMDDFERIDILVNCAEVEPQKSLLEMDEWDWVRTMDVNLNAAFLLTQSAGRIMREAGGGIIVHLGERQKGDSLSAAYSASKAGLVSLVRIAAQELGEFGIKVCLFGANEMEMILHFCEQGEDDSTWQGRLAPRLRDAPREINDILAGIPFPGLQANRPEGEWNAHQVLVHLRDVNREVYLPRLEQILNLDNPTFPEFDGAQWMTEHYDPAELLDKVLQEFNQQCEDIAGWLECLPGGVWQRQGTHVSLGTHPFHWWAERMVAHISEHLSQLRELKS